MDQKKIFDEKDLKVLPISFQFFNDSFDQIKISNNKFKHFSVEKYQTNFYMPDRFYKPISQIFSK